MSNETNDVTVTLPASAVADVLSLFRELTDRTHNLLIPGSPASLTSTDRSNLEMLVRSTEVARILSMSLQTP